MKFRLRSTPSALSELRIMREGTPSHQAGISLHMVRWGKRGQWRRSEGQITAHPPKKVRAGRRGKGNDRRPIRIRSHVIDKIRLKGTVVEWGNRTSKLETVNGSNNPCQKSKDTVLDKAEEQRS